MNGSDPDRIGRATGGQTGPDDPAAPGAPSPRPARAGILPAV
ncbi:hypothetical protein [Endosaccharibacter trunci]